MSGGPGLNFNTKSDLVANNTAAIARRVGCAEEGEDQTLETLECLRDVPFDVLTNLSVTASRTARPPFGEGFFFPTFDGDFIRDRPSQLMRSGKFVKGIRLIASWVTNDGAWRNFCNYTHLKTSSILYRKNMTALSLHSTTAQHR
ncbi:unnamed protein product [Aspergillus oryzae RIB40]|uniref:DNA, SC005 n=2 Tax=Aspergillus oryzae TaxID=5062 RepID=Q2US16_ASPOR|nr:unnamed protein product [Aspergillus oryzae RIB40]BAE55649.1 unnamed protein product [Aspergillus oryzae RIB40]